MNSAKFFKRQPLLVELTGPSRIISIIASHVNVAKEVCVRQLEMQGCVAEVPDKRLARAAIGSSVIWTDMDHKVTVIRPLASQVNVGPPAWASVRKFSHPKIAEHLQIYWDTIHYITVVDILNFPVCTVYGLSRSLLKRLLKEGTIHSNSISREQFNTLKLAVDVKAIPWPE